MQHSVHQVNKETQAQQRIADEMYFGVDEADLEGYRISCYVPSSDRANDSPTNICRHHLSATRNAPITQASNESEPPATRVSKDRERTEVASGQSVQVAGPNPMSDRQAALAAPSITS